MKQEKNGSKRMSARDALESILDAYEKAVMVDFPVTTYDLAEHIIDKGYEKRDEGEWILVAPRRTGRNATFKCSVCGKKVSSYYNDVGEWKCCPHCESKMRGESE